MPTLPDITRSERPTAQPGTGISGYAVPKADTTEGNALIGIGENVQNFALQVQHEQERADTLRAEDAFTQLRNQQLDLTAGEQGYSKVKGADAVNKPLLQDYTAKFDMAAKQISEGLANDDQKRKFQERANVSGLQFKEGILRHTMQESDVYSAQVYAGTVTTEQKFSAANWQEPNAVALSLERINAVTKDEAERKGWPAEFAEAKKLEAVSGVHSAVIGQAIASKNWDYAKQWYDHYKDQIDPGTAKQLEKAVEDAGQKQLTDAYTSQFLASRDDPKGLDQLARAVTADKSLDEGRKNALIGRIESRNDVIVARYERAQDRKERFLERKITEANSVTLSGYELSMDQITPLQNAAKGTALEGEVNQLVQTANLTKQFRTATPALQEQYITQLESAARANPGKFDVTVIGKLRTIQESQKTARTNDPVTFAVRQGLVEVGTPAGQPLDMSKPENLGAGLQARIGLARGMAEQYGAPVKPLTQEETKSTVAMLAKMNTTQKREYLSTLSKAAGDDFRGYSAVMAQIAPDNPVVAHAGIAAARKNDDGKGTMVADLLLRGQAILKPNPKEDGKPDTGSLLPMPGESKMRLDFDNYVRDAFVGNPNARSDYYQAAKAIYAARSVDAGDKDTSQLDSRRWQESITLATGGIDTYRGKNTILPWGKSTGEFKDGVSMRIDGFANQGLLPDGMTPGRLKDMAVEPVGDGRYVLKSGDGIQIGKDGRPLIIDFSKDAGELKRTKPALSAQRAAGNKYKLSNDELNKLGGVQ